MELDTTADADGTAFTLLVNGVPVFVRGVNWIPDDAFVTRVDHARYATRIGQAIDAGVNYLRVWGGGRYEADDFYDLADEHGLLIGQDFLFACAAYPEEEPLASEDRRRSPRAGPAADGAPEPGHVGRQQRKPLGIPGLGLAGGPRRPHLGRRLLLDILPGIVAAVDPTRPYWPGSPYSGNPDLHPNDPAHGTTHIWDVWNTHDYRHYATYQPRFLAEFGFQAPPAYADPAPRRLRRAADPHITRRPAPPESHRRQQQTRPRPHRPPPHPDIIRRLALGHPTQPGPRDHLRHRTLPVPANHCAWAPSCGNSTTTGPSPPGPPSTATDDANPSGTHYATPTPNNSSPSNPATASPPSSPSTTPPPHGTHKSTSAAITFDGDPRAKATLTIDVPAGGALTCHCRPTSPHPTTPAGSSSSSTAARPHNGTSPRTSTSTTRGLRPMSSSDPTADGHMVEVTARTFVRDLTLFADRLDPTATSTGSSSRSCPARR